MTPPGVSNPARFHGFDVVKYLESAKRRDEKPGKRRGNVSQGSRTIQGRPNRQGHECRRLARQADLSHPDRRSGAVAVSLDDLKALYFVKDLNGDSDYAAGREVDPEDLRSRGTTRIQVRFQDGEEATGLVNRYPPPRPYFFLLPADVDCNNIRVLVNRRAVASMSSPDF